MDVLDALSRPFRRFWETDRGLSILCAIVALMLFVLPLLHTTRPITRLLYEISLSGLLIAGIGVLPSPRWRRFVSVAVVVVLGLRWSAWVVPSESLSHVSLAAGVASTAMLAAVALVRVLRLGRVTYDHIVGAVAVYLLLGMTWAQAYGLLDGMVPGAFNQASPASDSPYAFVYFSVITLATVGYGDITPVHPIARSLAMLEALFGQLYLAILLARLVSLEVAERRAK